MATLREKYPLENRKPLKKTLARVWSFVPIFIFFILPMIIFIPSDNLPIFLSKALISWLIAVMFLIISVAMYIYEVFYMKYYFYDIVGSTLIIKKGVFSRNEICLPFNRLQDVYVDQDIWDRIFGLYDVHVSSATFISGWHYLHEHHINQKFCPKCL